MWTTQLEEAIGHENNFKESIMMLNINDKHYPEDIIEKMANITAKNNYLNLNDKNLFKTQSSNPIKNNSKSFQKQSL